MMQLNKLEIEQGHSCTNSLYASCPFSHWTKLIVACTLNTFTSNIRQVFHQSAYIGGCMSNMNDFHVQCPFQTHSLRSCKSNHRTFYGCFSKILPNRNIVRKKSFCE